MKRIYLFLFLSLVLLNGCTKAKIDEAKILFNSLKDCAESGVNYANHIDGADPKTYYVRLGDIFTELDRDEIVKIMGTDQNPHDYITELFTQSLGKSASITAQELKWFPQDYSVADRVLYYLDCIRDYEYYSKVKIAKLDKVTLEDIWRQAQSKGLLSERAQEEFNKLLQEIYFFQGA